MSLPNVSFTNNLGTLTFQNCLLGFSDRWEYAGRAVKHTKQIEVDAVVFRNTSEPTTLEAILTDMSVPGKAIGEPGTLTLPWTTLTNIRIVSMQIPDSAFQGNVKVQVSFSDDQPAGNAYTIHFFGMEVHNPRISVDTGGRDLNDEYSQMEWKRFTVFNQAGFGASVMRTKSAPGMMTIALNGTIFFPDGLPPDGWLSKLVQRTNMDESVVSFTMNTGWPRPFRMDEASPELAIAMPLQQIITIGGRVAWNVEEALADISIEMLCQPQKLSNS